MSGVSWYDMARTRIQAIHETLPADATYEVRRKALQDGYPFGPRKHWPYKAWLKAQREYLSRWRADPLPADGLFG